MNSKIILGFPGVGKSFVTDHTDISSSDSDSSQFDKANFPQNYIDHIESLIGKVEYIFVSTHNEVRKAIGEKGWSHYVVFPATYEKDDYMERYRERGSPDAFVELMNSKFEDFVEEIESEISNKTYTNAKYFRLSHGSTMADVIKKLYITDNIGDDK